MKQENLNAFFVITLLIIFGYYQYKVSYLNYIDWSAVQIDPEVEQEILENEKLALKKADKIGAIQIQMQMLPKAHPIYQQLKIIDSYKKHSANIFMMPMLEKEFDKINKHIKDVFLDYFHIPGTFCVVAFKIPNQPLTKSISIPIEAYEKLEGMHPKIYLSKVDLKTKIQSALQDKKALHNLTNKYKYAIKKLMVYMIKNPGSISPYAAKKLKKFCTQEFRWVQSLN